MTRVLNCREGRNILAYYEKHNEFDQCVRNELRRLIVRYVYAHELPHGPINVIDYVEQIIGTFPSESQVRIWCVLVCIQFVIIFIRTYL